MLAADILPPYEVSTIVRSMGFNPLDRPCWRHGRYVMAATDRSGREVRVVVDASSGQVIRVARWMSAITTARADMACGRIRTIRAMARRLRRRAQSRTGLWPGPYGRAWLFAAAGLSPPQPGYSAAAGLRR